METQYSIDGKWKRENGKWAERLGIQKLSARFTSPISHFTSSPFSISHFPFIVLLICLFGIFWQLLHLSLPSLEWIVIEPGVLQVIAIAFLAWFILLKMSKLIVDRLLAKILRHLETYFETSQELTSWQQHVLYLALFALLMLSGTGCLIAIC